MNFAGSDPGQSGALAIVSTDMQTVNAWDFPGSIEAAADLLRDVMFEYKPVLTGIEKVGAMPKQGVSSTFKFGHNYGSWLGAMSAL